MMRYYKEIDGNGRVLAIGQGLGHIEITETEYTLLLAEIREKSDLAERLYWGEITIDAVPDEWREDVQNLVDTRVSVTGPADEQEISAADALNIILGLGGASK